MTTIQLCIFYDTDVRAKGLKQNVNKANVSTILHSGVVIMGAVGAAAPTEIRNYTYKRGQKLDLAPTKF